MFFNIIISYMLASAVSAIDEATGFRATNIRLNSFTMTWNTKPSILYKISVNTDSQPVTNPANADYVDDPIQYNVTSTTSGETLQSNQRYYITLFAISQQDSADYNYAPYNVTTGPGSPKIHLSQPTGSSADPSTMIRVDWNKPGGGDAIDNYRVYWKLSTASSYGASPAVAHVVGTTSYSHVIGDLIPGESYDVKVKAFNSAGYGYSSIATYVILPRTPPKPTWVLYQVLPPVLKLQWMKPAGIVEKYEINVYRGLEPVLHSHTMINCFYARPLQSGVAYTATVRSLSKGSRGIESERADEMRTPSYKRVVKPSNRSNIKFQYNTGSNNPSTRPPATFSEISSTSNVHKTNPPTPTNEITKVNITWNMPSSVLHVTSNKIAAEPSTGSHTKIQYDIDRNNPSTTYMNRNLVPGESHTATVQAISPSIGALAVVSEISSTSNVHKTNPPTPTNEIAQVNITWNMPRVLHGTPNKIPGESHTATVQVISPSMGAFATVSEISSTSNVYDTKPSQVDYKVMVASDVIKLTWEQPDGYFDGFQIQLFSNKFINKTSSLLEDIKLNTSITSFTFQHLNQSTEYKIIMYSWVIVKSGRLLSSPTVGQYKTSDEAPGCSPTNFNAINFGFSVSFTSAFSDEKCPNSNRSIASIICKGINQLNINESSNILKNGYDVTSLTFIPCTSTALENFLNQTQAPLFNITPENVERITDGLQILTSEPTSLTIGDIERATTALNIIEARSVNQTIEVSALGNILHTINQLDMAVRNVESATQDFSSLTQNKSNLIASLNKFVERVNPPTNNERLTLRSPDIIVQIANNAGGSFKHDGNSTNYSDLVFNFDTVSGSNKDINLVTIPSQTIQLLSQSTSQRNDQSLFVTLLTNGSLLDSRQNIAQVITIGGRNLPQSDLSSLHISIRFGNIEIPERERKIKNSLKSELHDARLVEWDYETMTWNDGQCSQGFHSNPVYHCQRLGSFSILFSSRIVPSNFALSMVSYIGCGISILSLLATILIHIRYRQLRGKITTIGLINISICLIAVYLLFAAGVQNASNSAACNGLTFLLHYATLSCLMWMCINAGQIYNAFTKKMYDTSKAKTLKIHLVAYLLPLILVLINFSVTVLYLDTLNDRTNIFYESLYRLRHACWLKAPSFYWGFLLPAGLAILFNYILFILLIRKLTCETNKIRPSPGKKSCKNNVINGIVLATLMGLTWIFGYFLLISDDIIYQTAMQWVFTLTNVFQGLAIFVLNCLRGDGVRKIWLPACCVGLSLNQYQRSRQISTGKTNLKDEIKTNPSSSRSSIF